MFETMLARPGRRRTLGAVVTVSVLLHASAAAALVVRQFWAVGKLPLPEETLFLSMFSPPPPAPLPLGGGDRPSELKKDDKVEKQRVDDTVQPDLTDSTTAETPETTPAETAADDPDGVPTGHPDGVPDGHRDGVPGGHRDGVPGGTGVDPRGTVLRPKVVRAKFLEARRISGEFHITPPESVRMLMQKHDERQLRPTVKMCLSERGAVGSLKILKSSGYETYDAKILRTMWTWRYRPSTVNGRPIPVCTSVTFLYRFR